MRRPSLERWLRRELMELSGLERFSLLKLAALAQSDDARLREPLFLYCYACRKVEKLSAYIYRENVASSYQQAQDLLAGRNLEQLALSGTAKELLGRDFSRHLDSFAADYHKVETDAESKRLRCERCQSLRIQKGVSYAQLAAWLGLDPGNVCAFLKQGDLGRVTLQDATAMMKYLMAL